MNVAALLAKLTKGAKFAGSVGHPMTKMLWRERGHEGAWGTPKAPAAAPPLAKILDPPLAGWNVVAGVGAAAARPVAGGGRHLSAGDRRAVSRLQHRQHLLHRPGRLGRLRHRQWILDRMRRQYNNNNTSNNNNYTTMFSSLQCFDAVGWAAGRASGL